MVNSTEFGKRLQKILKYYSLSATAFSDKIDFNRSTISHLLSGRNRPSLEFVMKVLQSFPEVELYWLLNGTGSFPSTDKKTHPSSSKGTISGPKDGQLTDPSSKTLNLPKELLKKDHHKEIEQIILLYKDGSFKVFEN